MQTGTDSLHWVWIGAVIICPLSASFCIASSPNQIYQIYIVLYFSGSEKKAAEIHSPVLLLFPSNAADLGSWLCSGDFAPVNPGQTRSDEARWWVRKSCQQYRKRSNPGGPMRSWEKTWANMRKSWRSNTFFSKKYCPEKDHAHCFKKWNMGGKLLWTSKNYLPKNNKTIGECPSPNHLQPVRHLQPSSQLQHLDSQSWASWPRHGNHDRGYPEEQQACWDHWHGLYEIFI